MPRAVFLTHEPPAPAVSGARIRTLHLMRQLARHGWEVDVFALHGEADDPAAIRAELAGLCRRVELAALPGGLARLRRLATALLRREAFQRRFFHAAGPARALRESGVLAGADAIVVSLLYMLPYLPPELTDRAVLDTHNSETHRLRSMVRTAPRSPRGLVARRQAGLVREYERAAVAAVRCTLAVSDEERRWFEELAPGARVAVVPNGVDTEALAPRAELPAEPEIAFVGSMGYGANQDGVRWLLEAVLPHVRHPGARVSVAGAGAPRALAELAGRAAVPVRMLGFVPSTEPVFARARLLAVPLRIGGGTRLKILEALARGVPVVSTSLGCEGLGLEPGADLLVADGAEAFAAAIDRLLADDDLSRSLARHGRETAVARFDWARIGNELTEVLDEVRPATGATSARPSA